MQVKDLRPGMQFRELRDRAETKPGRVLTTRPQIYDEVKHEIIRPAEPAISLCGQAHYLHIRTSRGDWCVHQDTQLTAV